MELTLREARKSGPSLVWEIITAVFLPCVLIHAIILHWIKTKQFNLDSTQVILLALLGTVLAAAATTLISMAILGYAEWAPAGVATILYLIVLCATLYFYSHSSPD